MNKILSILMCMVMAMAFSVQPAQAKEKTKTETVVFALTPPPTCANCVNKIKSNLRYEKGVKDIAVDLKTKSVTITYSPKDTNSQKLAEALKKIGYSAEDGKQNCDASHSDSNCGECKN